MQSYIVDGFALQPLEVTIGSRFDTFFPQEGLV
jgi:hypothetical protein